MFERKKEREEKKSKTGLETKRLISCAGGQLVRKQIYLLGRLFSAPWAGYLDRKQLERLPVAFSIYLRLIADKHNFHTYHLAQGLAKWAWKCSLREFSKFSAKHETERRVYGVHGA